MTDHSVVIVGAGPVGLISAMDLAKKGVSCVVLEKRSDEAPAHPRCNTTSARTMEILRGLGCDKEYRECGLDGDYPNDVAYITSLGGHELLRYHLPSANCRWQDDRMAHDGRWNSSERPHRASQFYLERVLRAHAETFDEIDLRFFQEVTRIEQGNGSVTLNVKDTRTEEEQVINTRFLLGCDGGRSEVRRQSGIKFEGGFTGLARMQAVMIRSKDVLPKMQAMKHGPAWMTWMCSPSGAQGVIIAIDGEELWLTHITRPEGQDEITDETIDEQITALMGEKIEYEVLNSELWQLNRFVAERYREGNVFLAGDAAHGWPPFAGHGMNSGIEDAITITWQLAAVINGWAPESILDAYHLERQNVGDKVSRAAEGMAAALFEMMFNQEVFPNLEKEDEAGDVARKVFRNHMIEKDSGQFNPEGFNFGQCYDQSPLIAYDDGVAPEYEVENYTPTTVPGCRAPWFSLMDDGSSIYDHLCDGYTLLRSGEGVDAASLVEAAQACGMPFSIVEIGHEPKARAFYDHKLVLVRPDGKVAWRGNEAPADAELLINKLRGVS